MKKLLIFIPLAFFLFLVYRALTGTLPMALDIITGVYFPWLNYRYLGLATWTPVHNPYISDVTSQSVVWRIFLSDHIKNFLSIFWHNYSLSGYPYLGNSYLTPIFHPSTLLLFIQPNYLGISLVYLFQLFFLYFSALYLLRTLSVKNNIAWFTAAALTLGGQMATWFELGALNYVIASLLLCLALINEKRFLLLPAGIFLLFNSGHYQYIVYSIIILVIYGLLQSQILSSLKALFIGTLLSAIIILPTIHAFNVSIRDSDNFLATRNGGLISFPHLVTLISPDYFGNPATYNYVGEEDYQEKSGYMGIIFIPLFLYSLTLARRNRYIAFFTGTALISFILMTDNPVAHLVVDSNLPLIGNSKGSRPLVFFGISVVISSALALKDLLASSRALRLLSAISAVIGIYLVLSSIPAYNLIELKSLIQNPPARDAAGSAALTSFRTSLIPATLSLLFASFLLLKSYFRRFPLLLLTGLLVFGDLTRYFLKYNTFADSELFYPVTEVFAFLQNQSHSDLFRTEFYGTAGVPMNIWEAYRLESASGYTSIYPKRYGEFIGLVNDRKLNKNPGRFVHVLEPQSQLFDLLNNRYVLVNFSDCPDGNGDNLVCQVVSGDNFNKVFEKDNMAIFENTDYLPRFFFVTSSILTRSDEDIADLMVSQDFDPSQTVIVEDKELSGSSFGQGSVSLQSYSSTQIELKTDLDNQGLLFAGNTYDPGWSASIDGQESSPIYRVNYTFQGLLVPAGSHLLSLNYTPPYLLQGALLSLIGLVFYSGEVIISRRKTNRKK